ncbi:hypothetical protein HBI33_050160 [Parastagonospora nodorum]|nr:hypothetical protein HBI33_050160 [Parastagonospora nodorum]
MSYSWRARANLHRHRSSCSFRCCASKYAKVHKRLLLSNRDIDPIPDVQDITNPAEHAQYRRDADAQTQPPRDAQYRRDADAQTQPPRDAQYRRDADAQTQPPRDAHVGDLYQSIVRYYKQLCKETVGSPDATTVASIGTQSTENSNTSPKMRNIACTGHTLRYYWCVTRYLCLKKRKKMADMTI